MVALRRVFADAWIALPLGIYFAVALPLAFTLNVWKDDAYTLHTTASGLAYAFHQSVTFEQNAPLYYVLLALWRHIDASAFWARLFSVLCIAVVIVMLPPLARRYAAGVPAQWIALLICLSPAIIWSALEIRIFALVILLSCLLLLTFYDAFLGENVSKPQIFAYAALCVASAYTQYYLLFLIGAQGVTLLLYRRSRFGLYAAALVPLVVSIVPLYRIITSETANVTDQYRAPRVADSARMLVQALLPYVLPAGTRAHRALVYAIAFCAGAPALILLARFRERRRIPVIIIMFAAACLIFTLSTYFAHAWISSRHPSSLIVPLILSIFAALSLIRRPLRARVTAIVIIALLGFEASALLATYRSGAKEGDWKRVAAFLQAHERHNEPIFVFEAEDTLPLQYYYRGPNRVIGVPREINFRKFDLRDFQLRSPEQAAAVFQRVPSSGRVWLVTSGACWALNLEFGCRVLEQYVSSCCRTVLERGFYESRVRLLDVRSMVFRGRKRQSENLAPSIPVAAASAGFNGR
jgi:hypothetical protein